MKKSVIPIITLLLILSGCANQSGEISETAAEVTTLSSQETTIETEEVEEIVQERIYPDNAYRELPDFEKLLTEGTEEYNAMIANWDKAAEALTELRDAGIPVLWRPFHEFDGQWFWWGKGGSENFIKLWQMMYDRYTNEFGLTNLIWILGYSGEVKDGWYPGNEYCDIIGSDTYDNTTNVKAWKKLEALETGKPMTFHECGNVPSIEKFEDDGAMWSWFMIWHTNHIKGNNKENLKAVYNHEKAITLDELPDIYS